MTKKPIEKVEKSILTEKKLLFHKDRIKEFKEGGATFPIAFDIDLTNLCNHRCPNCWGSNDKTREDGGADCTHQDFERLKKLIPEIKKLGARSIIYSGGGEPTLYPHFAEILRYTKEQGLDTAVVTNGSVFNEEIIEAMVDCCTWIRISLDADGPEIYKIAHGMPSESFFTVVNNIKHLIGRKKSKQKEITVSTCFLIGPKTWKGAYGAAKLSRELGVDYIRIRPYFQLPGNDKTKIEVDKTLKVLEKCKELETENFKISYPTYRVMWMDDKKRIRQYKKCYLPHFLTYIAPDGNLYPCCAMKNDTSKSMGNIKDKLFNDVWYDENRKKISDKINLGECPNPCNYENHIKFLWDLIESDKSVDDYCDEKGLKLPEQKGIHKNFL